MENNQEPLKTDTPEAQEAPEATSSPAPAAVAPPPPSKSSKKALIIILIIVGALVVLGWIGTLLIGSFAGSLFKGFVDNASDGKIKIDDKSGDFTIQGEDGDQKFQSRTGVDLIEGYPSWVPAAYPGSTLTNSSTLQLGEDGESYTAIYVAPKGTSMSDVYKYYDSEIKSTGMEFAMQSQTSDSASLMTKPNDVGRSMTVGMSADDGEVTYSVTARIQQVKDD